MAYLFTCRPVTSLVTGAEAATVDVEDQQGTRERSGPKSDGKQAKVIRYWVVG